MTSTAGATPVRSERSSRAPFAVAFGFALATSSAVGAAFPAEPFTSTSVHEFAQRPMSSLPVPVGQTTSGLPASGTPNSTSVSLAQRIGELRALTGLTTDQVGRLFGVSRRSVHNWMNGNAMAPQHEERAAKILAIVSVLPGTTPTERRAALLDSSRGTSIFHELVTSRSEGARLQVAGVSARQRIEL